MREDGGRAFRRQRLEELQLHRRVGDVILAANDVGDFKINVVDDGGQGV